MQYRRFGRTNEQVSAMGFGTWPMSGDRYGAIEIDEAVKGPARAGGVVTIERQGDGEGCVRVAGDPPYRAGEQHLLLLENGRGGRPPHPVSPAGRFEVGPDKVLQAVEDTPVGRDIARQRLEQVLTRLRGS